MIWTTDPQLKLRAVFKGAAGAREMHRDGRVEIGSTTRPAGNTVR